MRKLILLLFFTQFIFSQEIDSLDEVVNEFIENYNQKNFKSIYLMTSEVYQKQKSLEKTLAFFNVNFGMIGKVNGYKSISEYKRFGSYLLKFEKMDAVLSIKIDDNYKIDGFTIKSNKKFKTIDTSNFKTKTILQEQLEVVLESLKKVPNNTQFAIAIIENGETTFFGVKVENDKVVEIENKASAFEVASITKVFTATLLANSVLEDKVKLDDVVNSYYDFDFKNNTQITFKELANHTSGLFKLPSNFNPKNARNPYKDYSQDNFKDYFSNLLELKSKGKLHYSNLGMALLGNTLEKIEKKSYETLLQEKIFSKYDMQNSTSEISNVKDILIKGLNSEGKEALNWERDFFKGNGAVLSTVEDLSKFVLAQFDDSNKELELIRKETHRENSTRAIGLGLFIKTINSEKVYSHNGRTGGYSCSMVFDPKKKNGVIALTNFNKSKPSAMTFKLMKTLY